MFLPFYAFPKNQRETFSLIETAVLECERLGFDSVWLDDHLMYGDWPILGVVDNSFHAVSFDQQNSVGNHGVLRGASQPSVAGEDGGDA